MWQRKIDLKITNKDTGAVLLSTSENRIDFVYQGNLSWMADTLKLDVYNLAPETLKMLLDTKRRAIKVDVGYKDEPATMSTMLNGYVVNVAGRKATPNHITSIWCIPFSAQTMSMNAGLNGLVYENGTLKGLIQAISKQAGYVSEPRFFGMDDDVLSTPVPSYIMRGSVNHSLSELGEQFRFYVRGTNSEVQIISMMNSYKTIERLKNSQISIHKLSIDKLKGTPQASLAMIDLTMNLNTAIDCGDIIDVTEFLGARTNDPNRPPSDAVISVNNADSVLFRSDTLWSHTVFPEYLVLYTQHVGSNFAAAWETRITGVQFNSGLLGNHEVSGNGVGPGTWDLDVGKEANKPKGFPTVRQSIHASNTLTEREAKALSTVQLTPQQNDAIDSVARGDTKKGNFLRDKLIIENRGHDRVRNVESKAGAAGPYQIMPETGRSLGMTINDQQDDRMDFAKSTAAAGKLYDELNKRYDGNLDAMNANYNGGNLPASQVLAGKKTNKETEDYMRMARNLDAQRGEQ